jgi:hypothetical protein
MIGLYVRRFFAPGLAVLALITLGVVLAADPGSQKDPLATIGYVQRFAQFQHIELAADQQLKLGAGSELVLVGQAGQMIGFSGYDQFRDRLVNLSTGEAVGKGALAPFQHYMNASTHEIPLRFASEVEAWVRGVWQ